MSNLYMMIRIPTGIGRSKIMIIVVSTANNNGKNSPFVLSADGMLVKEALGILVNVIRLMAAKMDEPISHMRGWINRTHK